MYESIVSGLIIAFITSLAIIAYRFPKFYKLLYSILWAISFIIFISIFSYNWAFIQLEKSIQVNDATRSIFSIIESKKIDWTLTNIVFISFLAYIFLLYKIHNILSYFEKDSPKIPKGD